MEQLKLLVENNIVNINERDNTGSTPAHKGKHVSAQSHHRIFKNFVPGHLMNCCYFYNGVNYIVVMSRNVQE